MTQINNLISSSYSILVVLVILITMSKRHILVDVSTPLSKQPKSARLIDWDLCVLCQEDTGDTLQCSMNSTKTSIGNGYKSLAEHLIKLQQLGHMSIDVDVSRLDEGDGIEANMVSNSASWHNSCRLKFNKTKLERLQKKKETQKRRTSSSLQTRSNDERVNSSENVCFFARSQRIRICFVSIKRRRRKLIGK